MRGGTPLRKMSKFQNFRISLENLLLSALICSGAKPVPQRKLVGHAGVTNLLVRLDN